MNQKILLTLLFFIACLQINAAPKAIKAYSNGLTVTEFKSIVVIQDQNGNKLIPQVGLSIKPGARVRTGPDSSILLSSLQGDTYFLEENSELLLSLPLSEKFKNLKFTKNTIGTPQKSTMEFIKGKIQTHIKPGQKEQVKIRTSMCVLSIKGTTFTVNLEKEIFVLDVLEGIVEMENDVGKVINVIAGMRANTQTWKPESLPKMRKEKMMELQKKNQKQFQKNPPSVKKLQVNVLNPSPDSTFNRESIEQEKDSFDDKDLDLVSPHHLGAKKHEHHHHDREHHDDHHLRDPSKRNPTGITITGKPPKTPTK